jgi:hypothetical protein
VVLGLSGVRTKQVPLISVDFIRDGMDDADDDPAASARRLASCCASQLRFNAFQR